MQSLSFDCDMSAGIPLLVGDPQAPGLYRVVVHGNSGTGKSTLTRNLAEVLGIEAIHLDQIHWFPGWNERPPEEMIEEIRRRFEEAARQNRGWVVDGNYESTTKCISDEFATDIICISLPLRRRVTEIYVYTGLDPPFWRYFPRAVLRTFRRLLGLQETCAPGCQESWSELFSVNSILLWVWTHHDICKERYAPRYTVDNVVNGGKWQRLGDIDEQEEWLERVRQQIKGK